jgi:hypothetical protein
MAQVNTKARIARPAPRTHEGAVAARINAVQQLRRSVMSCLLWEDGFYEDGVTIAERIALLTGEVSPAEAAQIAVVARNEMKLRHVPLLMAKTMAVLPKHRHVVAAVLGDVIQRPDEITEFLAMYQAGRTGPKKLNKLSRQVQTGLQHAFTKFDEYQLAKYDRATDVKLKDAIRLIHPKPKTPEQSAIWKRLVNGELATPDTWEVAISATKDKKAEWTRLLTEKKLGAMALLRNLRNMTQADVDEKLIRSAIESMKADKVLPFRFVAAAKYAPQFEPSLEKAMIKAVASMPKLPGHTVLLVDHSGSMEGKLSAKSEMTYFDAASALGMLLIEICDEFSVFTYSDDCIRVPSRHGFAMREAIMSRINPTGTLLGKAVNHVYRNAKNVDRLIVVTDEQSHDTPPDPKGRGYVINVAPNQNGVGYGKWLHIDGFSENVLSFIREFEQTEE